MAKKRKKKCVPISPKKRKIVKIESKNIKPVTKLYLFKFVSLPAFNWQVVSMQLMLISGYGEGGPSTFGYDASLACMSQPAFPRQSRARIEDLPCDFRRDNWCTVAGNAYPWSVHTYNNYLFKNVIIIYKKIYANVPFTGLRWNCGLCWFFIDAPFNPDKLELLSSIFSFFLDAL